jgi:3-deoxy-D-manno-octulosonic-acid transferase
METGLERRDRLGAQAVTAPGWRFQLARQGYNLLIHLLIPLALLHFLWRSRREPGYRRHLGERFAAGPWPEAGPDLWIHAVSLGEMRVAGTLVQALGRARPGLRIQLTTVTPAGRAEAERLRSAGFPVRVRYLPLDSPPLVRRFIRRLRARALILIETELWPNLLWQGRQAGLPMALVNARLSPRLRDTYRRFQVLYAPLLASLECVAAQGADDTRHFRDLGARRVEITGNLKFDLATTVARTGLTRGDFRADRLWLAGSTHPGEETILLDTHRRLRAAHPGTSIQLLLAPRHPTRAPEILAEANAAGFTAVARSRIDHPGTAADVVVLDTLGELAALYALADAAFVGGSLVDHGGQNPLEPVAAGCPTIIGPDSRNFADVVRQLEDAGAIERAANADALFEALDRILRDPDHGRAMAQRARAALQANSGATEATLRLLEPLLAARSPRRSSDSV